MNRGSRVLCGLVQATDGSFNEAPIHESGKCGRFRGIRPS